MDEFEGAEIFKCVICERAIKGKVVFCDFCGFPVCEDCFCYSEESNYVCNVFCLDCWVK